VSGGLGGPSESIKVREVETLIRGPEVGARALFFGLEADIGLPTALRDLEHAQEDEVVDRNSASPYTPFGLSTFFRVFAPLL
jgi:hypothetical protein